MEGGWLERPEKVHNMFQEACGKVFVTTPGGRVITSGMQPDSLSKEQRQEIAASLRRYFVENFDRELSEMQAGFLLEYFLSEIAPLAYNKGVDDARRYFFTMTEDLAGA